MKKSRLLVVAASLVLLTTACGKGGTSSTPIDEGNALAKALEKFGDNYTAIFTTNTGDDDSYHPEFLAADGYYANKYQSQVVGFVKVDNDEGKYHSFEHYVEGFVDEDMGEYMYFNGRRDFNDEDLKAKVELSSYFDASKFTEKSENVYHSDDEDQIVGYLRTVNTDMGYYAFGFGSGGVDITLDELGNVDKIELLGFHDEDDGPIIKDKLWATISFVDVGITKDEIMEAYLADLKEIPAPRNDEVKLVGRDGHNLYEGLEYTFEDYSIASVVGEDAKTIALTSSVSPYIAFETTEVEKFGEPFEHYGQLVSFTATITSENGHTVLKDVKDITYGEEYNFDTMVEITDGETYFYDFADMEYARNNNGVKLYLGYATYEGGTVSEQSGKEETITLSYIFDGEKYELPVIFSATTSQDIRSCWVDVANEGLKKGDCVNISDIMFKVVDGKTCGYITETSSFEKGISLADLCSIVADEDVPLYSGNLGPEFYFDMQMPSDDGVNYEGLLAIIDLQDGKADKFVEEYNKELTEAGYTKVAEEEADEITIYQYRKESVVIMFTSAEQSGNHYYYQFQLANLDKEIVEEPFSWSGTYCLGFEGDELEMHLYDDYTGDFGGDEFTWEEDGYVIKFEYNGERYMIGHNDDGSFWGNYTKGDSDYDFDYVWKY